MNSSPQARQHEHPSAVAASLAFIAAGAVVGLVSFVRLLEWALENHHTTVMVTAAIFL